MTVANKVRFGRFMLALDDRRLTRDDEPLELNARYFDALALLVRQPGTLVSKDMFFAEVWRGIPVTDEALTQCITTLRRLLGDQASNPRFIETVPKHGYRFIAAVVDDAPAIAPPDEHSTPTVQRIVLLGGAGTIGGGLAGLAGGLLYGFGGATLPTAAAMGATSVLLVLVCLAIVAGLIGGMGVGCGIALAELAPSRRWPLSAVTGALGGLAVGAAASLLGLDAFTLLLGRSPGDITGGVEGALLGAAVGLAAWLAQRSPDHRPRQLGVAALLGGATGALITALGGTLFGGSLAQLADLFPGSRLSLAPISAIFGEQSFGPVTQAATGAIEGALFAVLVIAANLFARRALCATPAVSATRTPSPSS